MFPTSGPAGSIVELAIAGYNKDFDVTATFNGAPLAVSLSSIGSADTRTYLAITPNILSGSYSIVVTNNGTSPVATFTVPPKAGGSVIPANVFVAPDVSTTTLLIGKLDTIVNWIFTIALLLAVIFLIIAAFDFITAGGEAAKLSEARQKIIWALVGIIIAGLAKGLPYVIKAILGA